MAENNIEVKLVDLFKLAELIRQSVTEILFLIGWEIVPIKTNNKLGACQSSQFLFYSSSFGGGN
ncbi:hypothetical protein [Chryseobacterium sp. 5_R23647]|uniref:hypothetical protein n=1 Tax=Chryseobacterium sp. 5_R23647 TaxID=2258964 RepID=UPI000E289E37|nr:hypothetical protein [Chryseobacterium sp. 5_R23647]REC40934.1 hypothetical protein DRF69_16900 [Chryseobacterium sp. 5_R23647]